MEQDFMLFFSHQSQRYFNDMNSWVIHVIYNNFLIFDLVISLHRQAAHKGFW